MDTYYTPHMTPENPKTSNASGIIEDRPMAAKTYKLVTLRFAYEYAMGVAKRQNGHLVGELPMLFDQQEAIVTRDLLDEALRKFLVRGQVKSVSVIQMDRELQNTFRVRFTIDP